MLQERLSILLFGLFITTIVLTCTVTYFAFAVKGLVYIHNIRVISTEKEQLGELTAVLSVSVFFTALVILAILMFAVISFIKWAMDLLNGIYEEAVERAKNEMLPQAETCAEDNTNISLEEL